VCVCSLSEGEWLSQGEFEVPNERIVHSKRLRAEGHVYAKFIKVSKHHLSSVMSFACSKRVCARLAAAYKLFHLTKKYPLPDQYTSWIILYGRNPVPYQNAYPDDTVPNLEVRNWGTLYHVVVNIDELRIQCRAIQLLLNGHFIFF